MSTCSSCMLITAMRKAVELSKLNLDEARSIIIPFTEGMKTFKETALELGLSEDQMKEILNPEYWDELLKD